MQVDITVNNILAIVNTKLLADYVKLDERLLQLCCIVKHWAKRRQACPSIHTTSMKTCMVIPLVSSTFSVSEHADKSCCG